MVNNRNNNLGTVSIVKVRELQRLIDELKNTNVANLTEVLTLTNTKLDALAALFGATFNLNGTLAGESYSAHTHNYTDATITDTADGSGTLTETIKITSAKS